MATITGANVVFTLTIPLVYPIPQRLQGFATDDLLSNTPLKSAEAIMGVDGKKSSGFVFVLFEQEVMIQADSASVGVFYTWWAQNQAVRDDLQAFGNINYPNLGLKYSLVNGSLTTYPPMANVKKLLQHKTYGITWESITVSPM